MELFFNADEPESFTGIKTFHPDLQRDIIRRVKEKSNRLAREYLETIDTQYIDVDDFLKETAPIALAAIFANLDLVKLL